MSNSEIETLRVAYNAGATDEYQRLTSPAGKIEFSKVCAAIEKYSVSGTVIYDIGCGPGRYTEYLINKGYYVGCVDLSEKSLALFGERLQRLNDDRILFKKAGCASELDWINSESADTIILLGPMYHITDIKKRKQVIEHCHRILKNNGSVISMFMSPFPALHPEFAEKSNVLETIEREDCIVTTTNFNGFIVPQYRCWPKDAIIEFQKLFTEIEVIHIDKLLINEHEDRKLLKGSCSKNRENYSHQYLVLYKKKSI